MIELEIKDKKDCMGCYACSNICPQRCISLESDSEGFWYPKVDYQKCIKCGLCVKVCPIVNKIAVDNKPKAYACMNKDEAVRLKSSSGGIFTLTAEQVIDNGGVVFGAGFDEMFAVLHSYVETKEELERLRGSKYLQSKIGDTYKDAKKFLKQGREVLFSGTPCQISGLKSYLGDPYEDLICIDIVCHGVPSPIVWQKYLFYRENLSKSSTQEITFRNKNRGWKRFSLSFLFKNNVEYIETLDKDLYMRVFLKDVCLRPSCYDCGFKTLNRESDITLADFWGIENILPEMDDDKGTSLIFVNSEKGQLMLDKIKDDILYKEVNIDKAVSYNSAAIKSVATNPNRDSFFEELDQLEFDKLVKKYCTDKIQVRVKRNVKATIYIMLKKARLLDITKKIVRKQ